MSKTKRNQQIVEEMIKSISKEHTLCQLMRDNKIAEIDKIYKINPYERDGDRRGLIVDVREKNAMARSKIIIDLKHGLPIINQVYDSLYEIGKDCSKRIILFSDYLNEVDKNIPAADYWVVNSLIHNLRQYPLGIHFYKMDKDTFSIRSAYTVQNWEPIEAWPVGKIPSKEEFMAETFWRVYFYSFKEEFYASWKTFCSGFRNISDWGHIIIIDCSFLGGIQLYWDQKGVRYLIKQDNDQDEYLKMVLDFEMQGLQERYGLNAVNFENVVGKLPRLHIKYSDRPFDWLYKANPGQITEFAKSMFNDAWDLRWRIEERIDGLMQRESA